MEPLWSPVVATGGNRTQIWLPQKPQKEAKTVAVGCERLPFRAHGKEGVSGSSPEGGPANCPFMDVPARAHRAGFECRLEAIESDSPVSLAAPSKTGDSRFAAAPRT
jgi:hypothetical protein